MGDCKSTTTIIFGILIITFFVVFRLAMIIPQMIEVSNVDKNEIIKSQINKGCVAMHFITMILGIFLGITVLLYYYDELFEKKLFSVAMFFFLLSTCIYIIVFFSSSQYQIIKNFQYVYPNIYSLDQLKQLWKEWSKLNPTLLLTIGAVNDTLACQSKQFSYTAESSKNVNDDPQKIELSDVWAKKGMVLLDLSASNTWKSDSDTNIENIKNKMLQCPQVSALTGKIRSIDTINTLPSSILITKNGKKPFKFNRSWVILQAIFWAGAVVGYELTSIPVVYDSIKKTDSVFPTSYVTNFNCNQLDWNCWKKEYSDTCEIKNTRRPIITKVDSSKKNNEISRNI